MIQWVNLLFTIEISAWNDTTLIIFDILDTSENSFRAYNNEILEERYMKKKDTLWIF